MKKSRAPACDDQRLRGLLRADEESGVAGPFDEESAEFLAAAQHVQVCPRCQARLSDLAADAGQWNEARRLLVMDATDAMIAAERSDGPWSSTSRGAKSTTWTESMVRQLLAPPSHPEMLGRLGRYEVERLIGSGGMGIVLKAFDTELNRPVAIKVLSPHLAGSGAARQRFAREARAAAAVVHEHVVAIHNVESDGAAPFLVMQFVAGESLQTRLDLQGPLDLKEILRIGRQTAAGLAAAHAQGLVHRDVKPSNILLEHGIERALLTDFGLARAADDASLTHTGYLPGTPHYMSPEQARGEPVDARSDLFSLGSVLYAMSAGRPPFRADTSFGVLRHITDTQPRSIRQINPDIPEWLAALIDKLLAKQPSDRFASAAEVADLLEQCLAHVQQPTVAPLPEAVAQLLRRSRPGWLGLGVGWLGVTEGQPQFAGDSLRSTPATYIIIASAVVILVLAASAAIYFTSPKSPHQQSSSTGSSAAATQQPREASDQSLSALDWDSAANEIRALSADIDALQQRAQQLWDHEPADRATTDNSSPSPGNAPENMP